MNPNDQETKCVLLASNATGTGVREQLDARGWVAHLSNDPLPALAELCLLDRLDVKRRAWGRTTGKLALVVVEPLRWSQLPAMLAAARRYVPAAALWTFDDGRLTPLVVPDDSDNGSAAPTGADRTNDATPRSYELSPTPEPPTAGRDLDHDTRQITGDEISMLLDGDFHTSQGAEPTEQVEAPAPPASQDTRDPKSTDKPVTDPEA